MSDHTTITPITKVCKSCGQEKPRSEYYKRKENRDGLYTICKECHRAETKKYKPKSRFEAGRESEDVAITRLRELGIYATNGKCSEWKNIDVVAWGCVRIEVKLSAWEKGPGYFRFSLGAKSARRWFDCDVVLLMCEWPDKAMTYHLFPPTAPFFFRPSGKLKGAVTWTPNKQREFSRYRHGDPLTDDFMAAAKDAWHLIERARLSRIKAIQAVPQERAA